MKHIRRTLAALLTMALLLTALPCSTFAEPFDTPAPTEETPFDADALAALVEADEQDAPLAIQGAEIQAGGDQLAELTPEPEQTVLPAGEAPAAGPEQSDAPAESIQPDEQPDCDSPNESAAPTAEASAEPTMEAPTLEPIAENTPEPSLDPVIEPSATPEASAAPIATPKPAVNDKHAREAASGKGRLRVEKSEAEIDTAYDLADFLDMSLSELADELGLSEDALLTLPGQTLEQYRDELSPTAGSNTYAGKISLGSTFGSTASSLYSHDYEIYISRSGRYLLSIYATKYMAVNVYNGSEFVSRLGHACNGYTTYWTVDLEKGNTYTFQIFVDGQYNSGYAQYAAVLDLHIDGSYKDRATTLAYGVYAPFEVKYSNDYQIFCFTALTGSKYRVNSTGSMMRCIEIYDKNFKPTSIIVKDISGNKYFDVSLQPGQTYYVLVHGRDYFESDQWWFKTGSGNIMIECLDANTSPITFSVNKTSVEPGFSDSIEFTVSTKYAKKVRLLVDGKPIGKERSVSGNKAVFSESFHTSGTHSVKIQGYANGSWSLLSETLKISVSYLSALGQPTFASISSNKDTAYAGSDYTLRWNSLTNAYKYSVIVYSGSEQIYRSADTTKTSLTIPGDTFGTAGIYTIELYGLAKRGQQSNPCARAEITVKPADSLVKPTGVELTETGTIQLALDDTLQLHASVKPANAIRKLTWTSSSKKIATVSDGVVTPLKEGTVTITVKTHNGKKDTVKVKIVDPNKPTGVALSHSGTVTLGMNDLLYLSASVEPATATRKLTWTSSSKKIATVSDGVVTPLKEGTVTITVKTHNGKKDTVKVKVVDPNKPTAVELTQSGTIQLRSDKQLQLYANLKPSTATRNLTWTSSNKKIATVENGLVTPLKAGTVTITVKTHNGKKDTVKVKITEYYPVQSIALSMDGNSYGEMYVGETTTLSVSYSPAKSKTFAELTWKSDNTKVVTVDANGALSAVGTGYALITATDRNTSATASFGVVVTRKPRYRAIVVVENTFVEKNGRKMLYQRTSDRNGFINMLKQQNFDGRKVEQIADLSNMQKSTLMSRLRSLPNQWGIHEDDVTYFIFGGHGAKNGTLTLYANGAENQYITPSELKSVLDSIPGKVVVMIGSCYSGNYIYDGYGSYAESDDESSPSDFTSAIIRTFASGDTLPVAAIDESGTETGLSAEDLTAWEESGVMPNSGELRQSKYYVLTAAAHNEQSWFYYWMNSSSSYKINESKSYSCFDRAVCYAGGRDSVTKKSTWSSGKKTLQSVYNTVQKKVDSYHKNRPYSQSVQVYPRNSSFVIFSK